MIAMVFSLSDIDMDSAGVNAASVEDMRENACSAQSQEVWHDSERCGMIVGGVA